MFAELFKINEAQKKSIEQIEEIEKRKKKILTPDWNVGQIAPRCGRHMKYNN